MSSPLLVKVEDRFVDKEEVEVCHRLSNQLGDGVIRDGLGRDFRLGT